MLSNDEKEELRQPTTELDASTKLKYKDLIELNKLIYRR